MQRKGDGLDKYPVKIVDNRPDYMKQAHDTAPTNSAEDPSDPLHNKQGDILVVQPEHLTGTRPAAVTATQAGPSTSSSSSSSQQETGGPPLPSTQDLDQSAETAIAAGRVPPWRVEGNGPSMRSSIRVDDNSQDISWAQGATPRTLPPPVPLHPRTILTMRSSPTGPGEAQPGHHPLDRW